MKKVREKETVTAQDKMRIWDRLATWIVAVVVIQVVCWFVLILYFHRNGDAGQNWANAGAFGDMFGGLTCLFSGLAFAGLIVTIRQQGMEIRLQIQEQRDTRRELEAQTQQFEEQNRLYRTQALRDDIYRRLELIRSLQKDIQYKSAEPVFTTDGIREWKPLLYEGNEAISHLTYLASIFLMSITENREINDEKNEFYERLAYELHVAYSSIKPFLQTINVLIKNIAENKDESMETKNQFYGIIMNALPVDVQKIICWFRNSFPETKYIDMLVENGFISSSDVPEKIQNRDICELFHLYVFKSEPIIELRKKYRSIKKQAHTI